MNEPLSRVCRTGGSGTPGQAVKRTLYSWEDRMQTHGRSGFDPPDVLPAPQPITMTRACRGPRDHERSQDRSCRESCSRFGLTDTTT